MLFLTGVYSKLITSEINSLVIEGDPSLFMKASSDYVTSIWLSLSHLVTLHVWN